MPEFIAQHVREIAGLDRFTRDYLEAVEWTLTDEIDRATIRGFAPAAIEAARADCAAFQQANADDLREYQAATGYSGGVDLWLTRNRHGAGFWDRGLGALGKRLTDAARLGERDGYQGDDGLIYIT